jgi:hypothetical protein
MIVQVFPIYGFNVGFNYWCSDFELETASDEETEHLFQLMFGIFGLSLHLWRQK